MGLTALAAARLLGLRTVGIYHTDFVQYVRYLTQDDDMAEMTWKYMLWFYDQADIILAPTEYYRRHLMDHGFAPAKLKVMARGVDTRQFHPKHRDPAYYDRFGLGDSFKFLYVGRISREKNLDRLISAFDRLRQHGHNASLVLVGDGPYRKELQARLGGRPIAFTGLIEGENLAAAYASADCMVFPSCTDTFGNVVLEAQASGLPVIVTDRGGPAEIVHSHESGIVVDHADGQAMLDAMELLFLSPEVREDLRSRGLRNAAECGWEQVLQSLWSLGQANLVEAEISAYRSPADGITVPGLISMELS
jgi:glycosyltransferase involved in cell wall biosynthesis